MPAVDRRKMRVDTSSCCKYLFGPNRITLANIVSLTVSMSDITSSPISCLLCRSVQGPFLALSTLVNSQAVPPSSAMQYEFDCTSSSDRSFHAIVDSLVFCLCAVPCQTVPCCSVLCRAAWYVRSVGYWPDRNGGDTCQFSPPPAEIQDRLTWRTDDTIDVIEKRLKQVSRLPYQ